MTSTPPTYRSTPPWPSITAAPTLQPSAKFTVQQPPELPPPTAMLMKKNGQSNPIALHEKESPIQAVLSDLKNPDEAVNAHQLGRFEFAIKLAAGGAIAILGSLAARKRSLALSEVLGFMGFYGAMAVSPHVIHGLVQQKTGLNLDHRYLSTQGDARNLFGDPQYLPLHLLPEKEIQRFADKLSIPKHLPNRRRVTEDRIRSTVAQAQTWWMLSAGPIVPILGSVVGRVIEKPLMAASNQVTQRIRYSRMASHHTGNRENHLSKLINTVIGDSPASEMARWWDGLQHEAVKTLNLHRTFAHTDKVARPYGPEHKTKGRHTLFVETLVNALHDLSPASSRGASQGGPERLRKLKSRLEQHYLPKLRTMESQASQWIEKYGTVGQKPYLHQALASQVAAAHAQVHHYQTLLDGLLNTQKPPTHAWIRTMIQNTTAPNMVHLLENGIYRQANELLGTAGKSADSATNGRLKDVFSVLNAHQQEKGHRVNAMVGGTVVDQLKTGVRESLNNRRFYRGLVGGIGGAVAVLSGIFYALALGNPAKRKGDYLRSPEEIKKKYDVSNQFEKLQAELAAQKVQIAHMPPRTPAFEQLQHTLAIQKAQQVGLSTRAGATTSPAELKNMFKKNQAIIYALNIRTFNPQDKDGDGRINPRANEQGTFLSAIGRLDELKDLGINTIHLFPINPPGVLKQAGNAGSVYAPADYHTLNPQLADKTSSLNIIEQARKFIEEAHKRGIKVMVDVPSCAAYDLAMTHPDMIAVDENGHTLTPATWLDIVMFKNDDTLRQYFEGFFDLMANQVGVDGFRVDVARARPNWFWKHFTEKYPNHAWLAESYVEEDASPLQNIPRDRPEQLLATGFDSIYGQNHIFHKMPSGQAYMDYLYEVENMFTRANAQSGNGQTPLGKSIIGSFLTHDDEETLMNHGGVPYSQLATVLMAFQPYTNPYLIDGMQTGYPHRIDIFNFTPAHKGEHPELATFMSKVFAVRKEMASMLAHGKYTPLVVDRSQDPNHMVIAYTLRDGAKNLLVVANKDPNARVEATIKMNWPANVPLINLIPEYGRPSTVQNLPPTANSEGGLHVNLGPARAMVFYLPG